MFYLDHAEWVQVHTYVGFFSTRVEIYKTFVSLTTTTNQLATFVHYPYSYLEPVNTRGAILESFFHRQTNSSFILFDLLITKSWNIILFYTLKSNL